MNSGVRNVLQTLCCATLGVMLLELVGGCSSGPAKVDITGKLLKDGQPLQVSKTGQVTVRFISQEPPDVEKEQNKSATVDPTGSFTIKGIYVGKYRVAVTQTDAYRGPDVMKGTFGTNNSPIFRDVASNGQFIEIDLAKEKQ